MLAAAGARAATTCASATGSTPATPVRATRSRCGSARASRGRSTTPTSLAAFEDEYRRIYGLTIPDVADRGRDVAARGVRRRRSRSSPTSPPSGAGAEPVRTPPGRVRPRRRRRSTRRCTGAPTLGAGDRFDGPAIVEERETTAVIRPGWTVEVGADGSLIATGQPAERIDTNGADRPVTRRHRPSIRSSSRSCWQSLIATVNEQARALQRSAFSPIVREAGDLANAVFDRRGRMVAQAVTGTPGHINCARDGGAQHPRRVPDRLARAGRRADHQRPVQDRRPAARRHRARAGVARRPR